MSFVPENWYPSLNLTAKTASPCPEISVHVQASWNSLEISNLMTKIFEKPGKIQQVFKFQRNKFYQNFYWPFPGNLNPRFHWKYWPVRSAFLTKFTSTPENVFRLTNILAWRERQTAGKLRKTTRTTRPPRVGFGGDPCFWTVPHDNVTLRSGFWV